MLTNFTPITNESIITELTRRLADRDEELDKHLCRIHKLEENAEDDCSCIENQRVEIIRLKALCQESRATAIEDAHAAYDVGCLEALNAVKRVLDGRDSGQGTNNPPWQELRQELVAIVAERDALQTKLDALEKHEPRERWCSGCKYGANTIGSEPCNTCAGDSNWEPKP